MPWVEWDNKLYIAYVSLSHSFHDGVVFSHAHKHTVMDLKWNKNGNWMLTASRDHLIKLFDVRNMKDEVIAFRGHKKEATSAYMSITDYTEI